MCTNSPVVNVMDMEKDDTQYWMAMLEVSECCAPIFAAVICELMNTI